MRVPSAPLECWVCRCAFSERGEWERVRAPATRLARGMVSNVGGGKGSQVMKLINERAAHRAYWVQPPRRRMTLLHSFADGLGAAATVMDEPVARLPRVYLGRGIAGDWAAVGRHIFRAARKLKQSGALPPAAEKHGPKGGRSRKLSHQATQFETLRRT